MISVKNGFICFSTEENKGRRNSLPLTGSSGPEARASVTWSEEKYSSPFQVQNLNLKFNNTLNEYNNEKLSFRDYANTNQYNDYSRQMHPEKINDKYVNNLPLDAAARTTFFRDSNHGSPNIMSETSSYDMIKNNVISDDEAEYADNYLHNNGQKFSLDWCEEESECGDLLPSIGAKLHRIGECKPCAFLHKERGCKEGRECTFCHSCDKEDYLRRKKQRALQGKAIKRAAKAAAVQGQGPVQIPIHAVQYLQEEHLHMF
jgi:hypothetical protein